MRRAHVGDVWLDVSGCPPRPRRACNVSVASRALALTQPLTQASALKETESGEARAALTIRRRRYVRSRYVRLHGLCQMAAQGRITGVESAFAAGAGHSAAARSKCVAASLSSAAERGPASQASSCPLSTVDRISLAPKSSGAALTTLVDSALSPSSLHHSGLATSSHAACVSMLKASAVARAHYSEHTGQCSLASRYRCAAST